ncbi:DUF4956 domain-containing protein [Maribellus sediminis]|uniref:DUF4956 domain-containing protein n=1 Tax=Maribellus sediminis TaxID=2696285 RepID=UPI0014318739|nr:DUF4956 domain-containing protein [Maribellus sediminis]
MDSLVILQNATFSEFWLRLLANTISLFVIIRFIYYPNNHRVKYLFVFSLMGMMIFLIASILDQVKIEMGFALGLFAVFAIIRFRSPQIDLKELTYLFIIIGSAIINALVEFNVETWFGLFVANFIIIGSTLIMEVYKPKNYVVKKMLVFAPSNYAVLNNKDLLRDEIIRETGINVVKVEIERINKVKEEVSVWIFFHEMEEVDESLFVSAEENENMTDH